MIQIYSTMFLYIFVLPETGDAFFEVRHREPLQMLGQSSVRLLGVVLGSRASSGAHFLAQ